MELNHFIELIAELPQNSQFKYVRGEDKCTFVSIENSEPRIFSKTPQGKDFSFAGSYLSLLAERIEAYVPFNISQLMNNSGSNRPVVETIVAHTKEFYWLQKNGAKYVVWIPSHPHNVGELVQWSDFDYLEEKVNAKRIKSNKKQMHQNDNSRQTIYYGAPGTGKSHEVKRITGECDNEERENVFRTTFHPDTDYASFVGCYKPTMRDTGQVRIVNGKTEKVEEISYEFVPQTFTDAYVYAYKNPDNDTFLVVEEINRGNCAQIFGDLFQLLDRKGDGTSEYRIKADKDLAKHLIKELKMPDDTKLENVKLCLPANLHILATMNTSDQSLFPMDSAFKRRWDWEYVPIEYKNDKWFIEIGEEKFSWVSFQKEINKRIFEETDSEDKKLGDYFVVAKGDKITEDTFKNKVLFYLWNDVFKDGESDVFKIRDKERFSFSEFYDKESGRQNLLDFMEKLGVEKF